MSGTDEGSSGPVMAMAVTPRARQSNYPPEFAIRMRGRLPPPKVSTSRRRDIV